MINLEGSYAFDNSFLKKVDYYFVNTEYSLIEQHAEEADHEEEEEGHPHEEEGPTVLKNDAKEYGAVVDFSSDELSQRLVMNIIKEDISIIGHEAFMKPTDNSEFSFGYYVSKDLDVFNFDLAIRHDRINRKGSVAHHEEEEEEEGHEHEEEVDKFDKDFKNDSLAISVSRNINEFFDVSMDLASVERAPSAVELYMNGPHLATGRYEIGNTNIDAERSRNIDLTLNYNRGRFFSTLTIFRNNVDDYIYLADSTTKKKKLTVSNYKQKDAQLTGYELEIGTSFQLYGGSLELSIARDTISGEFSDGKNIPKMTPERNIYSVLYSQDDLSFSLILKDIKQQDNLGLNETVTKGFQMLDANYTRKIVSESGTELYASVFGHNLLDEVARNHTSFVKDQVPLPGKNFGISFNLKF